MISCDQYDYIEIVCTFNYPIKLTMKSGEFIECRAEDTALNEARQECIKVNTGKESSLVVLDDLASLEVLVDNPHFRSISFVEG